MKDNYCVILEVSGGGASVSYRQFLVSLVKGCNVQDTLDSIAKDWFKTEDRAKDMYALVNSYFKVTQEELEDYIRVQNLVYLDLTEETPEGIKDLSKDYILNYALNIEEHDRVILTVDLEDPYIEKGTVGTVVYVYGSHPAYEVEVKDDQDRIIVFTVSNKQIKKLID